MNYRKLRSIHRSAVCLRHAGKVGVLAVKEISLVKAAKLLKNIRSYDDKAARTEALVFLASYDFDPKNSLSMISGVPSEEALSQIYT